MSHEAPDCSACGKPYDRVKPAFKDAAQTVALATGRCPAEILTFGIAMLVEAQKLGDYDSEDVLLAVADALGLEAT